MSSTLPVWITLFDHFEDGTILKGVLRNQVSIKKTRKDATPSLDTVKLCPSNYYIERSQGQCKI